MKLTERELKKLLNKNPNNAKLQGLGSAHTQKKQVLADARKKKILKGIAPLAFARTIGSIFKGGKMVDTTGHITRNTATMKGTRGERSRNGLRSEFTSRGYTGNSGTPELDNHWKDNYEVRGDIRIGKPISKGSLSTRAREMPNMREVSHSVGGDPILPSVKKFKKIGWF